MILRNSTQGIQGAKAHVVLASSRQATVSLPVYRHAQSQRASVFRPVVSQGKLQGLCSAQATSQGLGTSAPRANAEATHAIILGASVAGLLSAAALSDYVESVTVLDKDAFVNERLSHDDLKQVKVRLRACLVA